MGLTLVHPFQEMSGPGGRALRGTPELKPDVNHAVEGQLEGLVGRFVWGENVRCPIHGRWDIGTWLSCG